MTGQMIVSISITTMVVVVFIITMIVDDYLVSICEQAVEDPSLARGDPAAVGIPLCFTCPPQAGAQLHIGGCRHAQVVCFCPAGDAQLVLVIHQAFVHLAIARLDLSTVLVHILSTRLSQNDVISEIPDL